MHSATYETYVMQWYSIHLWSIGGGYICPKHMCILLYVKLMSCSGIPYIYGQLEGGTFVLSLCAFCYMLNLCGVVVFHRSMVNWRGDICPRYMCILLYVKLIWCSGVPIDLWSIRGGGLRILAQCALHLKI